MVTLGWLNLAADPEYDAYFGLAYCYTDISEHRTSYSYFSFGPASACPPTFSVDQCTFLHYQFYASPLITCLLVTSMVTGILTIC